MSETATLTPIPLDRISPEILGGIRAVLSDIDDTMTTDGLLPSHAYHALERLSDAGKIVIPVTGRPAGWCDMIARFWPVNGVVGENGAFYFRYDRESRKMIRRYWKSDDERSGDRRKLEALGRKILESVPGSAMASDQAYREADLAIDFCEDVEPLSGDAVDDIVALFEQTLGSEEPPRGCFVCNAMVELAPHDEVVAARTSAMSGRLETAIEEAYGGAATTIAMWV